MPFQSARAGRQPHSRAPPRPSPGTPRSPLAARTLSRRRVHGATHAPLARSRLVPRRGLVSSPFRCADGRQPHTAPTSLASPRTPYGTGAAPRGARRTRRVDAHLVRTDVRVPKGQARSRALAEQTEGSQSRGPALLLCAAASPALQPASTVACPWCARPSAGVHVLLLDPRQSVQCR